MKIKIIYSDKILDRLSWFMSIGGITLYPYIILREDLKKNPAKNKKTIRHETVHIKQQAELLVIGFYIWYFIEWFLKLFVFGSKAYRNISFEREAYKSKDDEKFLQKRKKYNWLKYI